MIWYPPRADDEAADTVGAAFVSAYGHPPEGVWAAPGRVNLIGEHVDYNSGLCLPLALPHRTYAAIAARTDDRIRLRTSAMPGSQGAWQGALDGIGPRQPGGAEHTVTFGWAAYVAGVAWALRQAGLEVRGFDVALDSTVPVGSGLSSSAALECSIAIGLDELFDLGLGGSDAGRRRLAAACVRAENEIAGAPTGGMDQSVSLLASEGHGLLLDCSDFTTEQIALDLADAELALLVIDTRAHHSLVDGQYGSRRSLCEEAAGVLDVKNLREIADGSAAPAGLSSALEHLGGDGHGQALRQALRHVVTEIIRVREVAGLLRDGSFGEIGPLLDASHASLRDDYQVSCPELDLAVDAARTAGALGARMTGGGFGGSAIALAHASALPRITARVAEAFASASFAPPAFLSALPSGPARRIA